MRKHLQTSIDRLACDTHGTIAVMMSFMLAVLVLVGGVAVDYGNALRIKSTVQDAADAAALAGASIKGATSTQRIAAATQSFQNNIASTQLSISPTVTMGSNGEVITIVANVAVPTYLVGVAGIETVNYTVEAAAALPHFEGEIVFVLDYSSSMTGGAGNGQEKWQAMRDAATGLVSDLQNGQSNPELKVGLVPFAKNVYLSLPGEYVLGGTSGSTWTNCTNDRRHPYVTNDSTPVVGNDATKWGRTDGNNDIDTDEYDDCANYPSRNLVVLPLTNNHASVMSQLASMVPHEGTNISAGISFGWHLISPNAPFTEGVAYNNTSKTIILLSDGEQTVSSFGPGDSYNVNNGESNLVDMCTAIKAQGVRLITVAFGSGIGGATLDRLQNCASTSYFFYNPTDGDALLHAFKDIGYRVGGNARLVN